MIEFVLSLPEWLGIGIAILLATVMGLVGYIVSHKLISKHQREELKDPMSSLFHVVGVLVSLMLSLAFRGCNKIADLRIWGSTPRASKDIC